MKCLAICLALGLTSVAIPATLTFDSEPPGRLPHNAIAPVPGAVEVDGWRFIPTLENVWVIPDDTELDDRPWMYLSPWLGFTGNSPATFVVERPGFKFDFLGFDSIGLQTAPGRIVSSAGHTLDYVTQRHLATHYDVSWHGLDWIRFEHDIETGFGPNGFDNLHVVPLPDCTGGGWTGPPCEVSEPWTVWLIGVGGLMLFAFERKVTRRRNALDEA